MKKWMKGFIKLWKEKNGIEISPATAAAATSEGRSIRRT